jgi:hypothetical protein
MVRLTADVFVVYRADTECRRRCPGAATSNLRGGPRLDGPNHVPRMVS